MSEVRDDLETLKRYLTHDERIGAGRYQTGVDSIALGIDAYVAGDVRGADENFRLGLADLNASGLNAMCTT